MIQILFSLGDPKADQIVGKFVSNRILEIMDFYIDSLSSFIQSDMYDDKFEQGTLCDPLVIRNMLMHRPGEFSAFASEHPEYISDEMYGFMRLFPDGFPVGRAVSVFSGLYRLLKSDIAFPPSGWDMCYLVYYLIDSNIEQMSDMKLDVLAVPERDYVKRAVFSRMREDPRLFGDYDSDEAFADDILNKIEDIKRYNDELLFIDQDFLLLDDGLDEFMMLADENIMNLSLPADKDGNMILVAVYPWDLKKNGGELL